MLSKSGKMLTKTAKCQLKEAKWCFLQAGPVWWPTPETAKGTWT